MPILQRNPWPMFPFCWCSSFFQGGSSSVEWKLPSAECANHFLSASCFILGFLRMHNSYKVGQCHSLRWFCKQVEYRRVPTVTNMKYCICAAHVCHDQEGPAEVIMNEFYEVWVYLTVLFHLMHLMIRCTLWIKIDPFIDIAAYNLLYLLVWKIQQNTKEGPDSQTNICTSKPDC